MDTAEHLLTARQKLSGRLFRDAVKILKKHGIPYWLESETLLGIIDEDGHRNVAVRDDVEIGIPGEYLDKLLSLRKEFFPRYRLVEIMDVSGRQWIDGDIAGIAILSQWKRMNGALKVIVSLKFRKKDKVRWVDNKSCKWVSFRFFENLETISVAGVEYPIPADAHGYLQLRFGNWREESNGWNSAIDDLTIVDDDTLSSVPTKRRIRTAVKPRIELRRANYHKRMKKMLLFTMDMLEKNGIRYWLEAGTLLGIVRDGDLIPWDYDADIGILGKDAPRVLKLRYRYLPRYIVKKRLNKNPWLPGDVRVVKVKTPWEKLVQINFHLDMFCVYEVGDCFRWIDSKSLKEVDKKFYENLGSVYWEGRKVPVPFHVEEYLTVRYGNWKIPDRDFDSGHSDGSIAERGF